jgi:hypothetical protein
VLFQSMPMHGGTPTVLLESTTPYPESPELVEQDDEHLYYFVTNGIPAGIQVIAKAGGQRKMIVSDVTPMLVRVDHAYVYWSDVATRDQLVRRGKAGGPIESLWSAAGRFVRDLTFDDCNIYWSVTNPAEIYYRAK